MNSTFPAKRREYLIISVAILKAARNGIRKTNVIRSVSLNYSQFIRYTRFLKARGFIRENDNVYQTTDKGLELIEEFDSAQLIRSVLPT